MNPNLTDSEMSELKATKSEAEWNAQCGVELTTGNYSKEEQTARWNKRAETSVPSGNAANTASPPNTYSVVGEHPILARPDKHNLLFNEAVTYGLRLVLEGYENVTISEIGHSVGRGNENVSTPPIPPKSGQPSKGALRAAEKLASMCQTFPNVRFTKHEAGKVAEAFANLIDSETALSSLYSFVANRAGSGDTEAMKIIEEIENANT